MAEIVATEHATTAEQGPRRGGSIGRLLHDRAAALGALFVTSIVLAAVVGPFLAPFDPVAIHADARLVTPGAPYWLGTDDLGRDLLSRVLYGARVSVLISLSSIAVASVLGVAIGMLAGFYRGWVDTILMRLMDVIFAFPAVLLALLMVALLGTDLQNLVIALVIVYVPAFARVARGSALAVAAEPYVESARALGASDLRLLRRHIAPNILAPIIVQVTVSLAYAILIEASLSFLGLGIQPPTPSWGDMMSRGKPFLQVSPWPVLVPGVALFLTVLGFNLLGDGLRDVLDPRLRSSGEPDR